ncbi:MAG: isomerase [Flavobacteriales bacterium]|nr:isomerase [Flavobacteriales bacterium]
MRLDIFQVDAFSDKIFKGNPACVIHLEKWLSDNILLKIAKENAVSETAFFINKGSFFQLRWFTPDHEIDLCGHATLATAHVIKSIFKNISSHILFKTMSGDLIVRYDNGIYYLDFPSRKPDFTALPEEIKLSLNIQPKEILKSRDYVLIYDSQSDIEKIEIDTNYFNKINLGHGGVIVTSVGNDVDFVSRYFTPQATILEDPVTGSAHCSLIPFWSDRLNKNKLKALQLSIRGGRLICLNKLDRVIIGGRAITYLKGKIEVDGI